MEYLALEGGPPRTITLSRETFQTLRLPLPLSLPIGARNPRPKAGLGLSAFARRY